MDVNIPKFYTPSDVSLLRLSHSAHSNLAKDDGDYAHGESSETRIRLTRELAHYLWDNYIEPNNAHDLFILGIGDAYTGLINLMNTNERCTEYIDYIFSFVAENVLQSVRRSTDDTVSEWYWKHSTVFVADDHGAWAPDKAKKLRKKYGALVRSPHTNLNDMLAEHKDQVCNKMWELTKTWRDEKAAAAAKAAQRSSRDATMQNGSGPQPRRQPPGLDPDMQTARVAMRGADSASPRSTGLRSPARMPPIGYFGSPSRDPSRR